MQMPLEVRQAEPGLVEIMVGEDKSLLFRYRPYRDRRGRAKVQLFEVRDLGTGRSWSPYGRDLPEGSRRESYAQAYQILWGRPDLCAAREAREKALSA